jgi:hypothetical protein
MQCGDRTDFFTFHESFGDEASLLAFFRKEQEKKNNARKGRAP